MTGVVTVAVDHLNPPFSMLDGPEVRGFSVDLIRAAFAQSNQQVEFQPVDGPMAQLVWLAAGRVQAAADLTITERRRAWFTFSSYYHLEQLTVFGLRGGPIWPGFRHFHGRLAVKANSYVHEYLIRHHPRLVLLPVDTTEAELEAVRDGRCQVFAATRDTGLALIAAGMAAEVIPEGTPFGPAPLALGVLRDDADTIVATFNDGLAAMIHAGQVEELRRTWLHAFPAP